MSLHLADVAQAVAPGAHAALLMDRAGWHCAKDLVVPDNLTLVLLPARAPELNPVENIWQFVRANWLSSRVFGSYTDLVDHGCYAWNLCVEPPYRPTLDHHVHRPPRLGQCMILNAGWYKLGLENLEAIARVEGVDGVFIGPGACPPASAILAIRAIRR